MGDRVAVVGSRYVNAAQAEAIREDLTWDFPDDGVLVTGDCKGVDSVAIGWAWNAGVGTTKHVADWKAHGLSAGPRRNAKVVADCDRMIAFFCERPSRGTQDAVDQAKAAGKPVREVDLAEVR